MNDPIRQLNTPHPSDEVSSQVSRYSLLFRQRSDTLRLVRQFLQIAKAAQRHRGMSMTLLAGNPTFEGDFHALQKMLDRRLLYLQAFCEQANHLIPERELSNIRHAWETIRADWEDDDVVDNFELHSHFIEQLHTQIASLAKKMELPISALVDSSSRRHVAFTGVAGLTVKNLSADPTNVSLAANENTARTAKTEETIVPDAPDRTAKVIEYPSHFKQIELLNFIATQIPLMVEQVARIRGLASYALSKGECDDLKKGKIRFALSSARSQHEKLRQQCVRLQDLFEGKFSSLELIQAFELKLIYLLNTVEDNVLGISVLGRDSRELFKSATNIIDAYLTVVEDAFDLVERWHELDLETWVQYGHGPTTF